MNRKSRYNLKIDFKNSKGSFIYDKNSKNQYLDFFGQYATLVLGYNHAVFKSDEYLDSIKTISHQKIVNNEIASDEALQFDNAFKKYTSFNAFHYYHYACTGALAVEAAIKTAIDYKNNNSFKVISFKGSFHGINGYGGIITDRFNPVNQRLDGFPGSYWRHFENPTIKSSDRVNSDEISIKVKNTLEEIYKTILIDKDISCILVEPIQCTNGDLFFTDEFFSGLRNIADETDTPLIFDEIQTGFCSTGKVWYFQNTPITPDILIFGKKTQLSGIMVNKKFANIFQKPIRLEVTWDADLIDMVRCQFVMQAFRENNIMKNVRDRSSQLVDGLKKIQNLQNLRNAGLLVAFDLKNFKMREKLVSKLFKNNMIVNPTKDLTIRLRPPLSVTSSEIDQALDIIKNSMDTIE